jgi:hypothetical protein
MTARCAQSRDAFPRVAKRVVLLFKAASEANN